MTEYKYTKDHECVYVDGSTVWIGITKYAQDALGDLVYVELPEIGKSLASGETAAVVESVKTAAEVYTPVAGDVIEVNNAMSSDFEMIKLPVKDGGWLLKLEVSDTAELAALMDASAYETYLKGL